MASTHLTAEQVATRLGVKIETVYAYVSRGVLHRVAGPDGRTSLFELPEVEQLAKRGRPRRSATRAGVADVVLATGITSIDDSGLRYRGHDAVELARTSTFEAVAELLWGVDTRGAASWEPRPHARHLSRAVTAVLPDAAPAAERLAVVTAALACGEPLRVDLQPSSVAAHGRSLLTSFPEALVRQGRDPTDLASRRRRVATALWPRLSPLPASRPRTRVLDAALILLADHELATSTLAARIAASTGADPYAVVLAGLGAASGVLHGKAAAAVHAMLLDADHQGTAEHAVARALRPTGTVPGFGHPIYTRRDPRADCLLELVLEQANRREQATVEAVCRAVSRLTDVAPNVDLALGALTYVARSPVGLSEAVFVIARTAGWIAHAMEEYAETPLRFRARAIYTGPAVAECDAAAPRSGRTS